MGPDQADFLGAMERWREEGVAPAQITASRNAGRSGLTPMTRPLVSVSPSREIQGHGQHGRGRQLRLRRTVARLVTSRGADVSSSPGTSRRPGGSSWPVLIDTDAGVFYTKLRGAAQAPSSLVAEIIVGALADALGLAVPARVLIDMPAEIGVDDPHWELAQLVRWSTGRNLGFQLLSNVRGFEQPDVARIEPELASKVVWLDGLVQNPDRTVKNPNMILVTWTALAD